MASASENNRFSKNSRPESSNPVRLRFPQPLPFFLFLAGLIMSVGLVIYGIRQLIGLPVDDE